MMRFASIAGVTLAVAAMAVAAAPVPLSVRLEGEGEFAVWQGEEKVAGRIRLMSDEPSPRNVKASFKTAADGSKVWNRWSEEKEGRFRLEVVERADGAVELSVLGDGDETTRNRRRGIGFEFAQERFAGCGWRAILGRATDYDEGSGVIGEKEESVDTRWFAASGIVVDFNPHGPAEHAPLIGTGCLSGGGTVALGRKRAEVIGMSDFRRTYGGLGGIKIVLRPGGFEDYRRYHHFDYFVYEQRLPPLRLVRFGAPKAGAEYSDGNLPFEMSRGYGWVGAPERSIRVGHRSGAYYSHAVGRGRAIYRFAGLISGFYVLTVQIGNYTGEVNAFDVSIGDIALVRNASVPKRKARTLSRVVHVDGDGMIDVAFDGAWIVSAIGLQPRLYDSEDFTVGRGFWYTDGFEPAIAYRNAYYRRPPVFATVDETVEMPVPGEEASAPWRDPPAPVELPDLTSEDLRWVREIRMWRLLYNDSTMMELEDAELREKVFAEKERLRYNAVIVNGMLSRHTFPEERRHDGQRMFAAYAETARRHGMKALDHLDVTLLWNRESGFRAMAERLGETMRDKRNNLVCCQLCFNNPELKGKLFAYLREQVLAGAAGLQLDEVCPFAHGCACANCRRRFAEETGWYLPLDETDPTLGPGLPTPLARHFREWQSKARTNWFVELRRHLKDVAPNLCLSGYGTLKNFVVRAPKASRRGEYARIDEIDAGRVMNLFGNEVLTENILQGARAVFPLTRTRRVQAAAFGAPMWNWYYGHNAYERAFSWCLANMCGQIAMLPAVPSDPAAPDLEAWAAKSRPMDVTGATEVAEVGMLFSRYSRDYGEGDDFTPELQGLAQELEAMHVPYEFFGEDGLDVNRLAKYKIIFLSASRCVADGTLAALRAFAAGGGRIYARPGAGSHDRWGEPRADVPSFAEQPSAAAFCADEAVPWQSPFWTFDPDPKVESAYRERLAKILRGATYWRTEGLPEKVYTAIWRERSGELVCHFLNDTGCDIRAGDRVGIDPPKIPFPELKGDIVFEIPAEEGSVATAYGPEIDAGGRPLAVSVSAERLRVRLPKGLFRSYAIVRITK